MESNRINSFTFYRDYFNLIDTTNAKDKSILLVAITDYVFKDIEPILTGHNLAIFNTLKHQLNASKNNSKRRQKNITEVKPKENQSKTKIKPKGQPEENKTSILSFKFYISNFKFNVSNKFLDNNKELLLKNKLEEWLNYKIERKEYYKETGFKSLVSQIDNNIQKYGVESVIELINECMANNYKGIIFEKLKKQKPVNEQEVERRVF